MSFETRNKIRMLMGTSHEDTFLIRGKNGEYSAKEWVAYGRGYRWVPIRVYEPKDKEKVTWQSTQPAETERKDKRVEIFHAIPPPDENKREKITVLSDLVKPGDYGVVVQYKQ